MVPVWLRTRGNSCDVSSEVGCLPRPTGCKKPDVFKINGGDANDDDDDGVDDDDDGVDDDENEDDNDDDDVDGTAHINLAHAMWGIKLSVKFVEECFTSFVVIFY